MQEWKKVFHANGNQKRTRVATLLSDKMEDKSKIVTRNEKGYYIIIKESTHQQDTVITSFYDPSIVVPKYIKQIQ